MTKFNSLLQEYRVTSAASQIEVAGDWRTRPGRESVKRNALNQLPILSKELYANLEKVAVAYFLPSNTDTDAFVKEAMELAPSLRIDFKTLLQPLYGAVRSVLGASPHFSPTAFTTLLRDLRLLGSTLGLDSIPDMQYDGPALVETEEQLTATVNSYLTKYMGPQFFEAALKYLVLDAVVKSKQDFPDPVVPVYVENLAPQLTTMLSSTFEGRKVMVHDLNKVVESVGLATTQLPPEEKKKKKK